MGGKTARAVIALRSALAQGTEPIALIGALALQNAQPRQSRGHSSRGHLENQAAVNEWALRTANGRLGGWTSQGISACMQRLAWADEQCKSRGGDPIYALENTIELIGAKGIQ